MEATHYKSPPCQVYRHCGSGDIKIPAKILLFAANAGYPGLRDFISPLISAVILFSKVHDMSYATCVSNNNLRNNFYGSFFSVSNEINPILVTHFLPNWWWIVPIKTYSSSSKKLDEKEKKKKKTRMAIAKLFELHSNATIRRLKRDFTHKSFVALGWETLEEFLPYSSC